MWHLNIPKIAHFYWGENRLSYMRYATLTSFIKYNPDWKVVLWKTKFYPASDEPFFTIGHDYIVDCTDYTPMLRMLPLEIREVNVEQWGIPKSASETHKSNLVIYHALSTEGGIWADMDILFFKPLTALKVNKEENKGVETFVCMSFYGHSCGFYMACASNKYFRKLLELAPSEYKPGVYQCVGPNLCNKYYRTLESIQPLTPVADIGMDAFYAHDAYHIDYLMKDNVPMFTENSVGLHWYGGHKPWKTFIKDTDGGLRNVPKSIIGDILKISTLPVINQQNMKISIVMAYYNRQNLLDKTMESIRRSDFTNYEVIIVDDGSDVPVVCPDAKIIRIEKKDKWWTNPCIPFNKGFKEATGDVILIQNPECYHTGDILSYVKDNIKPNTYLSFGCYALTNEETASFQQGVIPSIGTHSAERVGSGWYNHSTIRPKAYHFCSAITKEDLARVGGFDERYAKGVAFDDDDFIRTINRIGMNVRIIDSLYVFHQKHTHFEFESPAAYRPLHTLNQTLFNNKYAPVVPPKSRMDTVIRQRAIRESRRGRRRR